MGIRRLRVFSTFSGLLLDGSLLCGLDRRERRRLLAQIEELGATHALLAVVNKCLLEHLDALEQRRVQEDLLLVAIATNVLQIPHKRQPIAPWQWGCLHSIDVHYE